MKKNKSNNLDYFRTSYHETKHSTEIRFLITHIPA